MSDLKRVKPKFRFVLTGATRCGKSATVSRCLEILKETQKLASNSSNTIDIPHEEIKPKQLNPSS